MTEARAEEPQAAFSLWGFGLGTVAFAIVIVAFVGGPFAPQPDAAHTLGEMAGSMARSAVDSFLGRDPAPEPAMTPRGWDIDRALAAGSMVLAALAIFLGGLGAIRHEKKRAVAAAIGTGLFAIGVQFVASTIMMVLGVVLLLGVMAMVGDFLGGISLLE